MPSRSPLRRRARLPALHGWDRDEPPQPRNTGFAAGRRPFAQFPGHRLQALAGQLRRRRVPPKHDRSGEIDPRPGLSMGHCGALRSRSQRRSLTLA
ncbi:hypothetical protein PR202_ga03843 [Eleusine coracana subsp. coracana]|uniref:Uncharacterized protein n=1 Tax=Eleusine coracana subsp. coracana TaxID=191504 RepID=A0AAV5BQE8_ELECO|nr:hypothetical protein PR202_ga03843 [Eleusine coracana subsp. coracana]